MAREDAPLGPDEAYKLLCDIVEPGADFAIAVSGGVDSMALLRLAAMERDAGRLGPEPGEERCWPNVLTVDHGLRPEAAEESQQVAAWCEALGFDCDVLKLSLPANAKPAAVRRARYEALTDACREWGTKVLLTAHTRDDQAETVLMNMARGSGLWGLTGIPAGRVFGGVYLYRPLLQLHKSRLRATCEALGQAWVEDPTNADARTRRGAARAALAQTDRTSDDLVRMAANLEGPRRVLDRAVAAALEDAARLDGGLIAISTDVLYQDRTIALRAIGQLLAIVGGRENAPRSAAVSRLIDWLQQGRAGRRTLHGCVVTRRSAKSGEGWGKRAGGRPSVLTLHRECGRMSPPTFDLMAGERVTWDGRYRIRACEDVRIGSCDGTGANPPGLPSITARSMREALRTVPAWWDGERFRPLGRAAAGVADPDPDGDDLRPKAVIEVDLAQERLVALRRHTALEPDWAMLPNPR